jgi:hypothetical protein
LNEARHTAEAQQEGYKDCHGETHHQLRQPCGLQCSTSRTSDSAWLTPGMQRKCSRGDRCVRFVRHVHLLQPPGAPASRRRVCQ